MKNWKCYFTICLMVFVVFGFIGCGDDEHPKNQSATITNLFDNNSSATIKGNLTDTEWAGIPNKIKNALNDAFTGGTNPERGRLKSVFNHPEGITIIIEKNVAYPNYKVDNETTLRFNLGIIDSHFNLKIHDAMKAMLGEDDNLMIGKIIQRINIFQTIPNMPRTFFV